MLKIYYCLLLLCLSLNAQNALAQNSLKCNGISISKTIFSQDSMQVFDNYYDVHQNDVIKSIKESKYPIEVRFYVAKAMTCQLVTIYTLQSNLDSTKITKTQTMVLIGKLNGWKVARNINSKTNLLFKDATKVIPDNFCLVYNTLLKNNLFKIEGNEDGKLYNEKPTNGPHWTDIGGGCYFEVKLGDRFRNFKYTFGGNYLDNLPNREKNINDFIDYLETRFKSERK